MATVPKLQNKQPKTSGNIIAPKIINTRHKIVWTDDGAMLYQDVVSPQLEKARERWLDPTSASSMSILLQTTNMIMSEAASLTNKSIPLSSPISSKSTSVPSYIRKSNQMVLNAAKKLKKYRSDPSSSPEAISQLRKEYSEKKSKHQEF